MERIAIYWLQPSGVRMTPSRIEAARPAFHARVAGLLYVIVIVAGFFAELYVRGTLVVQGDAAATAHNILASPTLFRLGLMADAVGLIGYVWITLILYELLKPVNPSLSLLAALFSMVGNVTFAANLLNHIAPLLILRGTPYLNSFSADQLQTLALFFLKLHDYSYIITMIFFGIYVLLLGLLVLGSRFLVRPLGFLLVIGGAGDIVNSVVILVAPDIVPDDVLSYLRVAGAVAELSLCLWLLLFGVNGPKWKTQAAAA
jgi:hypothetical protein